MACLMFMPPFLLGLLSTQAGVPDSAEITRVDSAVSAEARAGFSGVVLIARGDTILLEKTYGRATSVKEPAFWLASDSKQFTATAVLRLQQNGLLSVTDAITRFFTDVPPDKRGITIHQLLTHTSGLPHAYAADGIADRSAAVRAILKLGLRSKPGEKYSYSNDGYTLLAAIVDMRSGIGFDRFILDSLFARAGMSNSSVWGLEDPADAIAPVAEPRRLSSVGPSIYRNSRSVGNWGYRGPTGTYASARDVHRWIQSLRAGKILDQGAIRALLGRHVLVNQDSIGQSYTGYGWGVRVESGKDVSYAHSGNEDWLGHNAIIRF